MDVLQNFNYKGIMIGSGSITEQHMNNTNKMIQNIKKNLKLKISKEGEKI